MTMSNVGRIAAGVAVGAAAVGAGVWASNANTDRTERITLERGRGNYWDNWGVAALIPEGLGVIAGIAALGGAVLVGNGTLTGRAALVAAPAAAALGAVTGFMVGRRVGEHRAKQSEQWQPAVDEREAKKEAERRAFDQKLEQERDAVALKEFQAEWGADDDEVDISFEDAAQTVIAGYDHNNDDSVDLHSGQPMAADERVADDHGGWRGGAWGPVSDPDSQVETLLPWFSGIDADKNQIATLDEVRLHLRSEFDKNGNDRLDIGEGSVPQGREVNDYEDFVGG